MQFRVWYEEWTGSTWIHRSSDPLSEADALHWVHYLAQQQVIQIRSLSLEVIQEAPAYDRTYQTLVL